MLNALFLEFEFSPHLASNMLATAAFFYLSVLTRIYAGFVSSSSSESDDLLEEYFDWKVEEFPEWAATLGVANAPVKLDNYSMEAIENQKIGVEYFKLKAHTLLGKKVNSL